VSYRVTDRLINELLDLESDDEETNDQAKPYKMDRVWLY